MSDEVKLDSSLVPSVKGSSDGESRSSVKPFISVRVPHNANRDEILGAVDRALATAELPFLRGPGASGSEASGGTLDTVNASLQSSPVSAHAFSAPMTMAAPADSSGGDDDLVILVQKEGG